MDQSDIIYTKVNLFLLNYLQQKKLIIIFFKFFKDYISVPQSNPDLDYLPPSAMNFGVISYAQPQNNTNQNHYPTQQTFSNDYNVGIGVQNLQNIYETYTPQSTFAPVLNGQGNY